MLGSDLAEVYGVETGVLNRAVDRNAERFPDEFSFRLTAEEWENLKCQFGTSSSWGGRRRSLPRAFMEFGTPALSMILKSARAVAASKVANKHREEFLTVARYLRGHTDKIAAIPFECVLPMKVKTEPRRPVASGQIGQYMDVLPSHVRRPVLMVLYYGLRSSAVCNLTMSSINGSELLAVDKGDVHRRIPIDDMLSGIIAESVAHRDRLAQKDVVVADSLFVNARGRAWDRHSLLHAAQKAWVAAGLEAKKIHEVRHTLGTMAGKYFTKGMIQAAMGHSSEKSSAQYFHPTEEMAAEVRQKIITELSQKESKHSASEGIEVIVGNSSEGRFSCPCCGANLIISKEKGRKP